MKESTNWFIFGIGLLFWLFYIVYSINESDKRESYWKHSPGTQVHQYNIVTNIVTVTNGVLPAWSYRWER